MTNAAGTPVPVPDVEPPRSRGQLIAIGAVALVAVAALAVFVASGDDDSSDAVSTESTPTVESTEAVAAEEPAASTSANAASVATDPPATEPPATEPPATEPAVAEPPATEPPVTEPPATVPPAAETATYQVTFQANWVAETHPATLPGNAHFSDPVIAVHASPGAMFVADQAATPGIEEMAEAGRTSTLLDELRATAGVSFADSASGVAAPAVGERTFDITLTQSEPLVSLVTMLAPSPDWFVGFADRALFVDGQWVETVSFDLGNYDAGTDSGPDFTSSNAATDPAEAVGGPRDPAFSAAVAEAPFGTVTITKTG